MKAYELIIVALGWDTPEYEGHLAEVGSITTLCGIPVTGRRMSRHAFESADMEHVCSCCGGPITIEREMVEELPF